MILDGFGIAGFRSFGDEMVLIQNLGKINIFIGKNNSGKSNVLKFCEHLSKIKLNQPYGGFNEELDFCVDSGKKEIKIAIQIKKDSQGTGKLYNKIAKILPEMSDHIPEWKDHIWLWNSSAGLGTRGSRNLALVNLKSLILENYNEKETNRLAAIHLKYSGGAPEKRAENIANFIINQVELSFHFQSIEAFRQITHEESESCINGKGLIRELRKLQSPVLKRRQRDKKKFDVINNFLRELLGEKDAFMEIPAEADEIYVSIKNKTLPLDSLGTGIHELIILAAAVTIYENNVFCIEEPEIHIHPELQKKFIKYLQKSTNNQYLISTHSNAFFDLPGVNIYHCKLIDNHTHCELATTDRERCAIIYDLGNKPSDLIQTNFVIWVEGPSDRIYLNHWIHGKDSTLEEGLHYSIMFYGGRLLSHLTFDSPEVTEFIQLCRLNQNAAIIVDSDKTYYQTPLNKTKNRIIKNFEENKGFVWVTKGREIENYIPDTILNNDIKQVHKNKAKKIKWERFGVMTRLKQGASIEKISVAKKVTEEAPDYSKLDLEDKIEKLIESIKKANS